MPYPYTYMDRMEDARDERYDKLNKGKTMSEQLVKEEDYNYSGFKFHEMQEDLVDILVKKTGKDERSYFRILVAYKFAEIASHMRTTVDYLGSDVPTNLYAVNLATSGFSKDMSMNILDKRIFGRFRTAFEKETLPAIAELNLQAMADLRVISDGIEQNTAERAVQFEYHNLPKFLYSFGAATIEGYKALRNKLSMAEIGSTSYIIGEIGSSMQANAEALTELLNSYDMGLSKQKLIKNDSNAEMYGAVPSNLFMFGTQSKLFDGGKIEQDFFNLLEEGYGRRLFFGYVENIAAANKKLTPEELYDIQMDTTTDLMMTSMSAAYEKLADIGYSNQTMTMTKEVAMMFIKYRSDCEELADSMRAHEDVKKAVTAHGYWRAIKLAGSYAFVDEMTEISMEHAKAAIALVEQSNRSFDDIARRPTSYVKLINYMADVDRAITQVELIENLPFYKGSEYQKKEMMTLALAHGYMNKIVVKKTYSDGVEFFKAERLDETVLDKVSIAWSKDITSGYTEHTGPWSELPEMICKTGYHYTVNSWEGGHRNGDNLIPGFDICVLDVDGGTSIKAAQALLEEYEYIIYETKRSTPTNNRFRVLIPLSHKLKLNREDFKEFMSNVFEYMPFNVDDGTGDCARKWLSNTGTPILNEGKMLDVYDFLPNTKKQEEMHEASVRITDADSVQKYFLLNHSSGRNNAALKYAYMLLDNGHSSDEVILLARDFNGKLINPLSTNELSSTVFKSVYKKEAEMEARNK